MRYRRPIAAWAVLGVVAFLAVAIVRLFPLAVGILGDLDTFEAVAYAASIVAMAWAEGYRGFQKRFSPRVIVRAGWLADNPRPWLVLLAPVMAMGLVHATTRRLIASWALVIGIAILVVLVGRLDPIWRGIVDAGVVVGLTWGTLSILVLWWRAMAGRPPEIPADVPAS